eukprot:1153800-Pelagomonas_calceolata.AAC.3
MQSRNHFRPSVSLTPSAVFCSPGHDVALELQHKVQAGVQAETTWMQDRINWTELSNSRKN